MTYHSHSSWKFEDEPTDAIVEEVVEGLKLNREFNRGEYFTPDAYFTFSAVDTLIFHIGMFLDAHEGQAGSITGEDIKHFLEKAPESGKVIAGKVITAMTEKKKDDG